MKLRLIQPLYPGQCASSTCSTRWKAHQGQIGYNPEGRKGFKCYCYKCAIKLLGIEPEDSEPEIPTGRQRQDVPEYETPTTDRDEFGNTTDEDAHASETNLPEGRADNELYRELFPDSATPESETEPLEADAAGRQHEMFEDLLKIASAKDHHGYRLNGWIAGPAGSGKTSAAKAVADVLELPFAFIGAITQTYGVFGYRDAKGDYARTPFREIWENGGVFLFDDFDASDPAVAVELNALLANGHCAFPDGIVPRHPDCFIILSANTWGHGATSEYVGRAKQDAAFLDRFVRLPWDYDKRLEASLAPDHKDWVRRVQHLRTRVRAKGLKVLVTPRATVFGAALLRVGFSQERVEQLTVAAAMTPEQWASVQ